MILIGKIIAMTLIISLVTSCARNSNQMNSSHSAAYYSPPPVLAPIPSASKYQVPTNRTSLDFSQLVSFEYDCSKRSEQIELLEDQIRQRTFYKVDGVDGNEYPDRISKRYFALVKYRIWSLRLGCKGSSVGASTQAKIKETLPNRPPDPVPRCYFEESTIAKSKLDSSSNMGESVVSRRKEVCTNYPLITSAKEIYQGDLVDPEKQLDKNISYIPNLRKWNGGVFQMASKTEIHRNAIVKFTVVLMWTGASWVVVDKF
jgi:hypothetical protein